MTLTSYSLPKSSDSIPLFNPSNSNDVAPVSPLLLKCARIQAEQNNTVICCADDFSPVLPTSALFADGYCIIIQCMYTYVNYLPNFIQHIYLFAPYL